MKIKNKHDHFTHLTLSERVQIEIGHNRGESLRDIAKRLGHGRGPSTVSRELDGRPRKGPGKYEAYKGQCLALKRERDRGKRGRLKNEVIRAYTKEKLLLGWSPEQISIRIERDLGPEYSISHEAIYQYVYSKMKVDGLDLRVYLTRRHRRRQTKGFRQVQALYRPTLPSIEERPVEVENRLVIGHFEGDTIVSRASKVRLKTLNERVTGLVFISRMMDGTTKENNRVIIERLKGIPSPYCQTLTQDRGSENFNYQELEAILGILCYFAHAYCSQERGSNENTNGLIRRYFPKGTDFAKVTDAEIKRVEDLLNNRPRKRLGGLTPYEVLYIKTGVALKG